jgi:hypothetical protein
VFQVFEERRPDVVRIFLTHLLLKLEVAFIVAVRPCASARGEVSFHGLRSNVGAMTPANDRIAIVAALVARWDIDEEGRLRRRWSAASIPSWEGGRASRPAGGRR